MRALFALLAWLCVVGTAVAQMPPGAYGPGPCPFGASSCQVTATGGTTAISNANRAAFIVNVMDFGADNTDTSDSSAAINAAFAAVRSGAHTVGSAAFGETAAYRAKIIFPQGTYKITSALNWTGLLSQGVEVDMQGAVIDCQVASGVCVDMMGDRYLVVRNLRIFGNGVTKPAIGVQYGRIANGVSADQIVFENPYFNGSFTTTAMLNVASEDTTITHMQAWNAAGAGSFTLIADGINHFNVASSFVTITTPANTAESFNDFHCIDCMMQATGGGNPLWVSNATGIEFTHSYAALSNPTGGAAYGVYLYGLGAGQPVTQGKFEVHFETGSMTDTFFFTGTNTTPFINGFTYLDFNNFATNSVFKADSGLSTVALRDADVRIAFFTGAANLVDTGAHAASIWTFSGTYFSPAITQFNAVNWQGAITIAQARMLANYGTGALAAQYPDSAVKGGNARGANAVDLQTARNSAAQVASATQSTIGGGGFNTASGSNGTVVGGQGNTAGQEAIAGGINVTASGQDSVAFGNGGTASGQYGSVMGTNVTDRGRFGSNCYASSGFAGAGDGQGCFSQLVGTGASTGAIRVTGDRGGAGAANCINIPNNTAFALTATILAFDHTTVTKNSAWLEWNGLLTRGANAASTTIVAATTPTPLTNGTLTGQAIAMTADTTNGCLNISYTPPSANTDTWNVSAYVHTVEVQ